MFFHLLQFIRSHKLSIVFLVSLFGTQNVDGQIKWDGGAGDGLWSSAANWSPDGVPNGSDDILLDNSLLAGTYTVQMPGIATTTVVKSVTITPASGNTITLVLPSTNTASPGLNIPGSGDVMVLNDGGVFQNSSGVASGPSFGIPSGTLRINNGGRYIHNTDGTSASIVSQLSTVAGTETGIFEYKVPTVPAISASGRIFGTLILNTNGGSKTYTVPSAASTLTVRGDFIVNNNTSLTWGAVANLIVNGKFQQGSSSAINMSSGVNSPSIQVEGDIQLQGTLTETGTGSPTFELNGTTNQNVSVTGSVTNSVNFKMNNSAGATLLSPVTLPATLDMTNGKIKTDNSNILTLSAGASAINASSSSFVEGPMRKIGNTTFTFPIGVGSIYAPLTTTNASGEAITDVFTAEYKRQNPQSSIGNAVVSGLNHVSYVEYWSLQQTTGTATKKVSLQVNPESFSKTMASTYVSRYNGSQWTNEGSVITSGPVASGIHQTGTLQSVNNLSSFGFFTLATDLVYSANPLPIKLTSFEAFKSNATQVGLNWKSGETDNEGVQFVVQKAVGNNAFKDITVIKGGASDSYQFTDILATDTVIYYRLRITDVRGEISYSKVVMIPGKSGGLSVAMTFFSQSAGNSILEIRSAKNQRIVLYLIDMQGKVVRQWNAQVSPGVSQFTITTSQLIPGIYNVAGITAEGEKVTARFIKQ